MRRQLLSLGTALVVLGTLTACDPPIPESLLVAQAEQTVQCGDAGATTLYLDAGFADLGFTWQELMLASCPDLIFELSYDIADADLVGSVTPPQCEAKAIAPLAYDAAAIAFYLDEAFALTLNGEAIQGIFSGTISNWSDPLIQDLNPEVELPDLEIMVNESSTQPAIDAMQLWTKTITGSEVSFDLLTDDSEVFFSDLVMELEPGSVALIPMSDALVAGATIADVMIQDGSIVVAESQSLYAGSTMFTLTEEESNVLAVFDPELEPQPFPGITEAAIPYEAMYPVKLYICGDDNLTNRAAARYLVRLDAQGIIATSTLQPLSEDVRIASAVVLGKGLPLPESDLSGIDN